MIYTCKPVGDCGITFISENVAALLGYRDQEVIQEPGFWIDCIHLEDARRYSPDGYPQEFLDVGAREFLRQPCEMRELLRRVRDVLDED